MSHPVVTGTVLERSAASLLGRIVGHNGQRITRASVSAAQYEVWDVEGSPPVRVVGPTSVVVNDVIFDALQTDSRWTRDAIGYNFRLDLPGAAFSDSRIYRVEIRLTPVGGESFRIAYELEAVATYGD